jgi:hypothetical protein
MKKTTLLLILIFSFHRHFGQSDDSITLSKEDRNVLIGTTVLRGSEKNVGATIHNGLYFKELKGSDCLSSGEHLPATEIRSIHYSKDSMLIIDIITTANCSHHFLGEIEVLEDSLINVSYHTYGGYALCNCCFGLTYYIETLEEQNFNPGQLKYALIEGDRKTKKKINWKSE